MRSLPPCACTGSGVQNLPGCVRMHRNCPACLVRLLGACFRAAAHASNIAGATSAVASHDPPRSCCHCHCWLPSHTCHRAMDRIPAGRARLAPRAGQAVWTADRCGLQLRPLRAMTTAVPTAAVEKMAKLPLVTHGEDPSWPGRVDCWACTCALCCVLMLQTTRDRLHM